MEQSREAHHHFMTLPFLQTGSNFKLRKKKKTKENLPFFTGSRHLVVLTSN